MMYPTSPRDEDYLTSDLDSERNHQQLQIEIIKHSVHIFNELLNQFDNLIEELEDNDMLGFAIVRKCQEGADLMSNLISEMDDQTEEERRNVARQCIYDLQLQEEVGMQLTKSMQSSDSIIGLMLDDIMDLSPTNHKKVMTPPTPPPDVSLVPTLTRQKEQKENNNSNVTSIRERITEDDVMEAMSGFQSFLSDLEISLRNISEQEAQEIANTGLIIARLFIGTMRTFQSSILHDLETTQRSMSLCDTDDSGRVEILNNDNDIDDDNAVENGISTTGRTRRIKEMSTGISTMGSRLPIKDHRVRALWPPIRPNIEKVGGWCKDNTIQATCIGLVTWPVVLPTALFVGTPIVICDGIIQHAYDSNSDSIFINQVEHCAAQIYHTGRLTLMTSKIVARELVRVTKKQIKKNGGPQKIIQNVSCAAVDRVLHPIETVKQTWHHVSWGMKKIYKLIGGKHRHNGSSGDCCESTTTGNYVSEILDDPLDLSHYDDYYLDMDAKEIAAQTLQS